MELDPKDVRRRLQASPCEFAIRIARVEEHSNGGRRGNYLVQQLQPFRRYLYVQLRRARDIAAWPAQGADEAELHRICRGREDDGYRGDCRFGGERSRGTGRRDYLHLAMNQIGYQCRQSVVLPLRPPPFDRYVAALNVTGFAQPLAKCGDGPRVATLGRSGVDEPDYRHRRLPRANDHPADDAAAAPSSVMNSRRLMSPPTLRRHNVFKCFPTFEHDAGHESM